MQGMLPHSFLFDQATDLIRLGGDHDGGYLVSESDVMKSNYLLSMGIADDWRFEAGFLRIKPVPITAYDASISAAYFLKKTLKSLWALSRKAPRWARVAIKYNLFFSKKNVKHIKQFVGASSKGKSYCDLSSALAPAKNTPFFLKIDIEGDEYDLLDELIAHQSNMTGLVIEFHDCPDYLARIESFIAQCELRLVHIHANNCAALEATTGLPSVLELTFSRHADLGTSATLPHPLDQPNDSKKEEILLAFSQ